MIGWLPHFWASRQKPAERAVPAVADPRLKDAVRIIGKLARENERLRAELARLQPRPICDLPPEPAPAGNEQARITVEGWFARFGRAHDGR